MPFNSNGQQDVPEILPILQIVIDKLKSIFQVADNINSSTPQFIHPHIITLPLTSSALESTKKFLEPEELTVSTDGFAHFATIMQKAQRSELLCFQLEHYT